LTAKRVESIRQKEAGDVIVRLIQPKLILDKKWLKGITYSDLKDFLVVKYTKEHDKHLPVWKYDFETNDGEKLKKAIWWSSIVHSDMKKKISSYKKSWHRSKKDSEKLEYARNKFNQEVDIEYFHTDDWMDAQDKYIEWCSENGETVHRMQVGKAPGDD